MLVLLAILFGVSLAQRPSNSSTCDYYATSLYGSNTSTTQFQLIQGIVALAFGGGFNLSNVSSEITGILNPGTFQNLTIDLRPWFNGSIDSTNLNNQAVGIDWVDEGTDPLYKFLSGQTLNVTLTNTKNEYRLFSHFFNAFAHIFGCTLPPPPPPSTGGPLSLAYVHKFMNLSNTDLGHFIDQLTRSTEHFGFSDEDGTAFSNRMNDLYNVRCAPPITLSQGQGPQLLSLCQNPTCPLAVPSADCAAYVNLTADGSVGSSASAAPSSTSISLSSSSTSSASTSTSATTTPSSAQTTTAAPAATSTPLSSGDIAGIAVGGAAGLALLLGFVYFCARRRRPAAEPGPAEYVPETTYAHSTAKDPHMSYTSNGGTVAEMESPRFASSPAMGDSPRVRSPAPVEMGNYDQREDWDRQGPDTISPDQRYG